MPSWARMRDGNEAAIVDALRAAGASVSRLTETGCPDLLVGFNGQTWLIEIKLPRGARGGTSQYRESEGGAGDMTAAQVKWWAAWRGAAPTIVRTVDEALALIGAPSRDG